MEWLLSHCIAKIVCRLPCPIIHPLVLLYPCNSRKSTSEKYFLFSRPLYSIPSTPRMNVSMYWFDKEMLWGVDIRINISIHIHSPAFYSLFLVEISNMIWAIQYIDDYAIEKYQNLDKFTVC